MDLSALQEDLERELSERFAELRFYQNQLQTRAKEQDRNMLRRPLILLLYAHYEGFTKFAMDAYISAVNSENLECANASSEMAAASMADIFAELRNPQPVSKIFRGQSPGDLRLGRFARERQFVEQAYELLKRKVEIPDNVLDTESNLNISVLRKLLYRIGLSPELFDGFASPIQELVQRRNLIAHGADRAGVEDAVYGRLRDRIMSVMSGISRAIVLAAGKGEYRRVAS